MAVICIQMAMRVRKIDIWLNFAPYGWSVQNIPFLNSVPRYRAPEQLPVFRFFIMISKEYVGDNKVLSNIYKTSW